MTNTTNTENAAIMAATDATNALGMLVSAPAGATFCSITQDGTRESAAKIYAAMNDPANRVADFINKTISISDVFIEIRDIVNEDTGEIARVPRVVLIGENGEGYQATSFGIFQAVKSAYLAFGPAPWIPALDFTIKQRPTKNGSMLTASVQ